MARWMVSALSRGEHFGRPAGGGEQYDFAPQSFHQAHQSADEGCLARSGIAAQDEGLSAFGRQQEAGQVFGGQLLFRREGKAEFKGEETFQFIV